MMDSEDYTYWLAYLKNGTLKELREDHRAGTICSLLAMILHRLGVKNIPVDPSEYFHSLKKLKVRQAQQEQTPEEQYRIMLAYAIAMGAEIKKE